LHITSGQLLVPNSVALSKYAMRLDALDT
jgi:hypothetical protein